MSHFKTIIGQSPSLDSLIRSAKMVAATDVTVLLQGETGTGKDVAARLLHASCANKDKPFVHIDCAS